MHIDRIIEPSTALALVLGDDDNIEANSRGQPLPYDNPRKKKNIGCLFYSNYIF